MARELAVLIAVLLHTGAQCWHILARRPAAAILTCMMLALLESITCVPPAHCHMSSLIPGLTRGNSSGCTDLLSGTAGYGGYRLGRPREFKFGDAPLSQYMSGPDTGVRVGEGDSQGKHEGVQGVTKERKD